MQTYVEAAGPTTLLCSFAPSFFELLYFLFLEQTCTYIFNLSFQCKSDSWPPKMVKRQQAERERERETGRNNTKKESKMWCNHAGTTRQLTSLGSKRVCRLLTLSTWPKCRSTADSLCRWRCTRNTHTHVINPSRLNFAIKCDKFYEGKCTVDARFKWKSANHINICY